jgi:hypothetical protein
MPLTDFLKNFLRALPENVQYLGTQVAPLLGPNWQQAIQAEQQRQLQLGAAQQQQENWEKQFAAQQAQQQQQAEFERGRLSVEALRSGLRPQPAQTQGGPSLYGNQPAAPSFGGGGGVGAAPEVPNAPPSQTSITSIAPWLQMFGMQQQGGQGVNAPGQVTGAVTTPSMRMPAMGGASDAGGAVAPAAAPVMPTPFNIPGLQGQWGVQPELQVPMSPTLRQLLPGLPAQIPASQLQHIQPYLDTLERMQAKAITPEKEPSEPAAIQQTAAQLTAKEKGLTGTFKRISDLPLENQEAAWEKDRELRQSESDKINKQLAIQAQKDREEKYANQKASDDEVLNDIQRDPQSWFSIKDKDQQARVRQLAKANNVKLPSREVKATGQIADSLIAADTIQQQVARMRQIATALGPTSFGAMMGRLKNAEGEWGDPVFTDPLRAQLEEEFRGYSRNLSAQEAKLVGGGRTSVVIYNAIKGVTPGQWMDPAILEGAFRQAVNRAQMTKNAIKRWQFGDIDDPYANYNSPIGQYGTIGGKRVKITGHDPKTGLLTYEEAPAK